MLADFPFPETLPTLQRQFRLLAQGRKPAVYVPHWSPQIAQAAQAPALVTPAGVIFYDGAHLTPDRIHSAVARGRLGEILGYGLASKPEQGDRAVTLLDATGHEVAAVLADAATEATAREALGAMADPDDTLITEPPVAVLRRRADWWAEYFQTINTNKKGPTP